MVLVPVPFVAFEPAADLALFVPVPLLFVEEGAVRIVGLELPFSVLVPEDSTLPASVP